jgi:hypothetical protein
MRQKEEENRQKFLQERENTKKSIHDNVRRRIVENHQAGEEIKHQRVRIA